VALDAASQQTCHEITSKEAAVLQKKRGHTLDVLLRVPKLFTLFLILRWEESIITHPFLIYQAGKIK